MTEPFADAARLRAGWGNYESALGTRPLSEPPRFFEVSAVPTLVLYGPEDHVIWRQFPQMCEVAFSELIGPFTRYVLDAALSVAARLAGEGYPLPVSVNLSARSLLDPMLPAEVRRALNVQEGDYLEAQIVKEGVLLKPVAVVKRERAWQRIQEVTSRVRDRWPDPSKSNKEEEEEIAESIKEFRRKNRKHA